MLTMTVAPTSSALTTLASVKAELEITTTADDDYLGSLISSASAAITSWLRRGTLGKATYQETFRTPASYVWCREGRLRMMLTAFPVVSITSVTEDGNTLTANVDYDFTADGLVNRLSNNRVIAWTGATTVINYVAGWALPLDTSPTVPSDIQRAANVLIRDWYQSRGRDSTVKAQEIAGLGSMQFGTGASGDTLPAPVEALLHPWRSAVI